MCCCCRGDVSVRTLRSRAHEKYADVTEVGTPVPCATAFGASARASSSQMGPRILTFDASAPLDALLATTFDRLQCSCSDAIRGKPTSPLELVASLGQLSHFDGLLFICCTCSRLRNDVRLYLRGAPLRTMLSEAGTSIGVLEFSLCNAHLEGGCVLQVKSSQFKSLGPSCCSSRLCLLGRAVVVHELERQIINCRVTSRAWGSESTI